MRSEWRRPWKGSQDWVFPGRDYAVRTVADKKVSEPFETVVSRICFQVPVELEWDRCTCTATDQMPVVATARLTILDRLVSQFIPSCKK